MLLARVKMAFPFRLAVPGCSFIVTYGGQRYSVVATSGPARRVFHYGELGHPAGGDELLAVFADGDQEWRNRETVFTNDPNHYLASYTDHVGYTFVNVLFEVEEPSPRGDKERLNEITSEGFAVARHFVDAYRELTNESDVFHPSIEDSPGVEIDIASEYQFDEHAVRGKFIRVSQAIRWHLQHVTGATKGPLSPEKVTQLSERLKEGHEVPVHVELLLDAKDYSIVQRNHRLSIVTVAAAFEVFVNRRLAQECEVRQLEVLPVVTDGSKTRPINDALESGSLVRHLLTIHCRALCGHSVKSVPEYREWRTSAYEPRNEIVHDGRRRVDEAEARAAFDASVAFMNYLDAALVNSR